MSKTMDQIPVATSLNSTDLVLVRQLGVSKTAPVSLFGGGGGGGGTITNVTGTAPVVSSGGTIPNISMTVATGSVPGYLTAADWTIFNGKQAAGSYATGTGTASGTNTGDQTNISGNAGSVGGLPIHTATNNEANKIVRTDSNGYLQVGYINSANGNEGNASSPPRIWGTNGSDTYFRTYLTSTLNAGTATTLLGDETSWLSYRSRSVANMLGWKNYGNGYVIFDASAGTSPSGVAVNNTNSASPWTGSYPTLMGWNGTSTYGVRVDSARVSDNVKIAYSDATNSTYQMLWGSANYVYGGSLITCNPSTGQLNVGSLVATGNVSSASDERLKTNWRDLPTSFVENLALVKSGIYDRTDQTSTQVGVSAQSLAAILPDAIMKSDDGMLSVAYGNAALIACVMLAREVQALKASLAEMRAA